MSAVVLSLNETEDADEEDRQKFMEAFVNALNQVC
jgi:ABC-type transporter MlaC component